MKTEQSAAVPEPELNEQDKQRIHAAYEHGIENMTPEDLDKILAEEKTAKQKAGNLKGFFDEFKLLWALLQDYKAGRYRRVPWKFIAAVLFALAYLIAPVDVIPDFIPLVGYIDDTAVFGLLLSGFKSDINAYRQWKEQNDSAR